MGLLFAGPLRCRIRGSRGWVWSIASSVPGTGRHCRAGIQIPGMGSVGRAGHHLTRARPSLPLPPHTGIPKCLVTPDLPSGTTRFSTWSLRTLCGLATVKDWIVLLFDLRVGLFLSRVTEMGFCDWRALDQEVLLITHTLIVKFLLQISQWFSFFPLNYMLKQN